MGTGNSGNATIPACSGNIPEQFWECPRLSVDVPRKSLRRVKNHKFTPIESSFKTIVYSSGRGGELGSQVSVLGYIYTLLHR